MELASEDALRLNVLLAGDVQAIRIHESSMTVYGLSERGEARIALNPTGRDEQYLKLVRETISGHVLGSPGGYPVYLRRWTRMGQARDESLEQLLRLGEPEAVVAVVHAPGLTPDLARRAWWAMPDAENARSMLARDCVVAGDIGRELAAYLIEHLPFEDDPSTVAETIRLVLRPGLIDGSARADLWRKGQRRPAYLLGFLRGSPEDLPEPLPAHPAAGRHDDALAHLAGGGNAMAACLRGALGSAGQTWIATAGRVLRKPADQDVVLSVVEAIAGRFAPARLPGDPEAEMDELSAEVDAMIEGADAPFELHALGEAVPELRGELRAMALLARLGYPVLRPVFSRSSAVGSLMQRKLEPVTGPIFAALDTLLGRDR